MAKEFKNNCQQKLYYPLSNGHRYDQCSISKTLGILESTIRYYRKKISNIISKTKSCSLYNERRKAYYPKASSIKIRYQSTKLKKSKNLTIYNDRNT